MNKTVGFAEVSQICARYRVAVKDLRSTTGSFGKQIFFVNGELLLRVSATPMAGEQERFRRVAALQKVPHIKHAGVLEREAGPIHYTRVGFRG